MRLLVLALVSLTGCATTDQGRAMQATPAGSILVAGGATALTGAALGGTGLLFAAASGDDGERIAGEMLPLVLGGAIAGGLQLGIGAAVLLAHRDALDAMVRGEPPRDMPTPGKRAPAPAPEPMWPHGETIVE